MIRRAVSEFDTEFGAGTALREVVGVLLVSGLFGAMLTAFSVMAGGAA